MKQKRKADPADVALFVPSFRGGGAEIAMARLANGLAGTGCKVDFLVLQNEGPWQKSLSAKVNLVSLDRPRALTSIIPLRQYLIRSKPRLLVSNLSHLNIVSVIAKRLSINKTKLFVVEHNDLEACLRGMSRLKRILMIRAMRSLYPTADKALAVSDDLARSVQLMLNLKTENVGVLPNSLDLSALEKMADEPCNDPWVNDVDVPLLLAAGRMVEQKGFGDLLDAIAKLQRKVKARLLILGDGPLREQLKEQARSLGLAEWVRFPGFQSNPYPFFKRANVFILSSRYEGFGIVVLEALACGTPVVATDCHWGPREILKGGDCGLLVPIADADKMADAIVRILTDSALADRLRSAGIQRANDFGVDRVLARFKSLAGNVGIRWSENASSQNSVFGDEP